MSKLLTPKITISAAMHFNPSENLIKNPVCFFFQLYSRCAFQSQLFVASPGSHCFSGSVSIDRVSIDVAQFFWIGLDLPASWYWSIKSILRIQQFLQSMNHKIGWTILFSRRKISPFLNTKYKSKHWSISIQLQVHLLRETGKDLLVKYIWLLITSYELGCGSEVNLESHFYPVLIIV